MRAELIPLPDLSMSGPKLVRALLDTVPFLTEGNVKNAAGDTPDAVVAAGSLVAIFGVNLAQDYIVGPASPLAANHCRCYRGCGGQAPAPALRVTRTDQCTAAFATSRKASTRSPSAAAGQTEINGKVSDSQKCARSVYADVDSKTIATAFHQDGKLISIDSPALKGETVTLFGTGFGPYERKAPDGFALPAAPLFPLLDKLEVLAGDRVLQASWSGAAAGLCRHNSDSLQSA